MENVYCALIVTVSEEFEFRGLLSLREGRPPPVNTPCIPLNPAVTATKCTFVYVSSLCSLVVSDCAEVSPLISIVDHSISKSAPAVQFWICAEPSQHAHILSVYRFILFWENSLQVMFPWYLVNTLEMNFSLKCIFSWASIHREGVVFVCVYTEEVPTVGHVRLVLSKQA